MLLAEGQGARISSGDLQVQLPEASHPIPQRIMDGSGGEPVSPTSSYPVHR